MNRVDAALKDLRKSVSRIKELSAWLEIKQDEDSRGRNSLFLLHDPTEFDLKVEIGFFLKLSTDLRDYLAACHRLRSPDIRKRLSRLEREFSASVSDWRV